MESYFDDFASGYWTYYLELEQRIEETRRYVEYDTTNYKTYSSYYLMLYQTVCSEIDVVGKEIAGYFNPAFKEEKDSKKTINRWWYEVQDQLPDLNREIVFACKYPLYPWKQYRVVKAVTQRTTANGKINAINYNLQKKTDRVKFDTPKWWNAYNKVKHQRLDADDDGVNYKKANLLNLSNAFAALYLLEFEFMKKIGSLEERVKYDGSILFGMGDLEDQYIDSLFVNGETLEFRNSKKRN